MAFYFPRVQSRPNPGQQSGLPPTYGGYDPGRPGFNNPSGDPLGRGGQSGLRDILERYFLPEVGASQGRRGGIESAFFGQVTQPGSLYGAASTAATGVANQLFAPGGEVANLIGRARGQTIGQGFDPGSAFGSENEILRGATRRVADTFATQAAGLEGQRFGALSQLYGDEQTRYRDLIESLFTGVGSAEQFGLARNPPRQKFLGIFGWMLPFLIGIQTWITSLLV